MKWSLHLVFFLIGVGGYELLYTQGNVIITFKPYNQTTPPSYPRSIVDKPITTPLPTKEQYRGWIGGILARLNGYSSISDTHGIMVFPREAIENILNILVTTSIKPIIYHGNTVHHWILTKPKEAAMFQAVRNQDPQTEIYSWDIKQVELPPDAIIPDNTLVLFGRPSDVMVPTGNYITRGDPHLILPHFFVRKALTGPGAYLRYLRHSALYRLVKKVYKDAQDRVLYLIEGY